MSLTPLTFLWLSSGCTRLEQVASQVVVVALLSRLSCTSSIPGRSSQLGIQTETRMEKFENLEIGVRTTPGTLGVNTRGGMPPLSLSRSPRLFGGEDDYSTLESQSQESSLESAT